MDIEEAKELAKFIADEINDAGPRQVNDYNLGLKEGIRIGVEKTLQKVRPQEKTGSYKAGYKAGWETGKNYKNDILNKIISDTVSSNGRVAAANKKLINRIHALNKANKALKKRLN